MSKTVFDLSQLRLHYDKLVAKGVDDYDLSIVAAAVKRPYGTLMAGIDPIDRPEGIDGVEVYRMHPDGSVETVQRFPAPAKPNYDELVRGCLKTYGALSFPSLLEEFESFDASLKRHRLRTRYPMWPANNYNPDEVAQLGHA